MVLYLSVALKFPQVKMKDECFCKSTHWSGWTVIHLPDLVQNHVLDEDRNGLQDKWHKQVDVDVVPRAVKLPGEETNKRDQNK